MRQNIYVYNEQVMTLGQLCEIAKSPCSNGAMSTRIKRHGIKKAVEHDFIKKQSIFCCDKKTTIKVLAQTSQDPCSPSAMSRRISTYGLKKATEEDFSRGKHLYEGKHYTLKRLGEIAVDPCSEDAMGYRVKKHGVKRAVEEKFSAGNYLYSDQYYTLRELGMIAFTPCSKVAMGHRVKKYGIEEAVNRDFSQCSAMSLAGKRKTRKYGGKSFEKYSRPDFAMKIMKLIRWNKKRSLLSLDEVYAIGESQSWRCALSGIQMTCIKGNCPTNLSLDRIIAGGPYTADNIRLVCVAINSFRNNTPTEDFVHYCTCVANHNKKELKIASQAS